jgi:rRNA maturation RNase YbeY
MKLLIRYDYPVKFLPAVKARRWAVEVLRSVKGVSFEKQCELSIVFTGGTSIRKMNWRYRRKDKITDVLAFPLREGKVLRAGSPGAAALGDVVICVPQAFRQAKTAGKTPLEETALLLIHGILHLLGYDHVTLPQEKRMFGIQSKILKKIGFN